MASVTVVNHPHEHCLERILGEEQNAFERFERAEEERQEAFDRNEEYRNKLVEEKFKEVKSYITDQDKKIEDFKDEVDAQFEDHIQSTQALLDKEYLERTSADGKQLSLIQENKTSIQANAKNVQTESQTRQAEDARIEDVIKANKSLSDSNFASVNKTIADNTRTLQNSVSAVSAKIDQKDAECIARLEAEKTDRLSAEALIYAYVDSKSAGALHYRGSVATYDKLPKSGMKEGDMYNVEEDGQNYAWTGTTWDSQGPLINLKPLEQGIADNATAIQNEVTNRQAASNTLQANINKEVTDRQSACNTLQTNITNEKTRAKGAEGTLQSNITKEETRAKAAEKTLQTNIDTEASNRQTSESTLKTELLAEISKKTSAEIAQDFEQTKAKINAVADFVNTDGFWVFAVTDANGNVTFGQTINGDIISFADIVTAEQVNEPAQQAETYE